MASGVLLDNYTLQGAYGYLAEGKTSSMYENSLCHLIEAIVAYESIYVPADVLDLNQACRAIAERFDRVIQGRSMARTPDLHHNVVDPDIVDRLRPILTQGNPFGTLNREMVDIEWIGRPNYLSPPGSMGRHNPRLTFEEQHLYYTWYCMNLAADMEMNYAPHPIRSHLIANDLMKHPAFVDSRRDLLKRFEKLRDHHRELVDGVFDSLTFEVKFPLVYSHVKALTARTGDLVTTTMRVRDSEYARAFRRFCETLDIHLNSPS